MKANPAPADRQFGPLLCVWWHINEGVKSTHAKQVISISITSSIKTNYPKVAHSLLFFPDSFTLISLGIVSHCLLVHSPSSQVGPSKVYVFSEGRPHTIVTIYGSWWVRRGLLKWKHQYLNSKLVSESGVHTLGPETCNLRTSIAIKLAEHIATKPEAWRNLWETANRLFACFGIEHGCHELRHRGALC